MSLLHALALLSCCGDEPRFSSSQRTYVLGLDQAGTSQAAWFGYMRAKPHAKIAQATKNAAPPTGVTAPNPRMPVRVSA